MAVILKTNKTKDIAMPNINCLCLAIFNHFRFPYVMMTNEKFFAFNQKEKTDVDF